MKEAKFNSGLVSYKSSVVYLRMSMKGRSRNHSMELKTFCFVKVLFYLMPTCSVALKDTSSLNWAIFSKGARVIGANWEISVTCVFNMCHMCHSVFNKCHMATVVQEVRKRYGSLRTSLPLYAHLLSLF